MSQGTTKGIPIDTDTSLSANSNALVSSQRAVKTYTDTLVSLSGTTTATVSAALNNTLNVVTAVDADYVLIQDASDSFSLRKALKSDFGGGSGSGNVSGPSSATDNAIVRFDATTGKLIQNSNVTITDAGNITLSGTVDGRDISVDGTKLDTIEVSADVTDTANVSAALSTSNISTITPVSSDFILFQDISDSYSLRKTSINSLSGVILSKQSLIVAVSDETTALTVGINKITFRIPYDIILTDVRGSVNTAPTGADLIVDINKNGASILSANMYIDINEKTSFTSGTPVVITSNILNNDDEITVDIVQIGSIVAGGGLKIMLIGYS